MAGGDSGTLWIDDGACWSVEHDGARGPVTDEVQLLQRVVQLGGLIVRHREGTFRFVSNEEPPWRADGGASLLEALGEIDRQLARWEEVRKVVPSLDVTAKLSEELVAEQMLVDRERWRVLAGIGAGKTVREMAEGAPDQLALCQAVAALVEAGAVSVSQPLVVRPVGRGTLAESPYGPGVDDGPAPALDLGVVTRGA